jgi:hypothetical protein
MPDSFTWYADACPDALLPLTGIGDRAYFLDPGQGVELYRRGRPLFREIYPEDSGVRLTLTTPLIKYGHVSTLGAGLQFPENGQIGFTSPFASIDEVTAKLQRPVDFAKSGMTPFYLYYLDALRAAFPEEEVSWGWQWEGPITTAWELLGNDFWFLMVDRPEAFRGCLQRVAESIADYCRFYEKAAGHRPDEAYPDSGKVCDDIAAMLNPDDWEQNVLPQWRILFDGPLSRRALHCEDMKAAQLRHLAPLGLTDYDPGISASLNPAIIGPSAGVRFGWRLGSIHIEAMGIADAQDFVWQAAADGAAYVFTYIDALMCRPRNREKVMAFIETAREAQTLVRGGTPREALRQRMSPPHQETGFWDHWGGFRK